MISHKVRRSHHMRKDLREDFHYNCWAVRSIDTHANGEVKIAKFFEKGDEYYEMRVCVGLGHYRNGNTVYVYETDEYTVFSDMDIDDIVDVGAYNLNVEHESGYYVDNPDCFVSYDSRYSNDLEDACHSIGDLMNKDRPNFIRLLEAVADWAEKVLNSEGYTECPDRAYYVSRQMESAEYDGEKTVFDSESEAVNAAVSRSMDDTLYPYVVRPVVRNREWFGEPRIEKDSIRYFFDGEEIDRSEAWALCRDQNRRYSSTYRE